MGCKGGYADRIAVWGEEKKYARSHGDCCCAAEKHCEPKKKKHCKAEEKPCSEYVNGLGTVRTMSGANNNLAHPRWGMAGESYERLTPNTPFVEGSRPNGRFISTQVCRMDGEPVRSRDGLNDLFWILGQLWDHTVVETPNAGAPKLFPITEHDDPAFAGYSIPFTSSARRAVDDKPFNKLSAFGDLACLYGANEERCMTLRKCDGSGEMKVDKDGMLPYNLYGMENANEGKFPATELYLAGDVRANEHPALTAMHTLWAWEHNYWCHRVKRECPHLYGDDELTFQMARRCLNAVFQSIIYKEFVPVLLGRDALKPYRGYNPKANPTAMGEFAAVAFRIGHTMVSSTLHVGTGKDAKHVPLRDVFFNPSVLKTKKDVRDFLLGASQQLMQEPMGRINNDLRNVLFDVLNPETKMMLDLCFANIQRGRDFGIPNYNKCRTAVGLPRIRVRDISSNPETRARLIAAFGDDWADNVDAWVGGVCEDHHNGGLVGPLFHRILKDQFERTRDGDRFWCENDAKNIPDSLRKDAFHTSLANVFRRHFGKDCGIGKHALFVNRGN